MKIDNKKKISFIIPVKNRDRACIQRCVTSLESRWTKEIIIIDYGSIKVLKDIRGAKIIRYNKNKIWNKAHALNLGIKQATGTYIGTVDCDMIVHPMYIPTAISHLDKNTLIYTLDVKRLKVKDIDKSFFKMKLKSAPWVRGSDKIDINHTANGGIQIYPKRWIIKIWGLDESLIYWGGMDNDIIKRAIMSGMVMVDLNLTILHQEHSSKKEVNLPPKERIQAFKIRIEKIKYLAHVFKNKIIKRNRGGWGKEQPNQKRFLKWIKEYEHEQTTFKDTFKKAIKKGQKSFKFQDKTFKVFK